MAKTHGTMDQFEAQVRARIDELADPSDIKSASNTPVIASDDDRLSMKQFLKWLRSHGIDVTIHNYELQAEKYERYTSGSTYTYRFKAPGDWVAYMSMLLHRNMTPANIMDYVSEWLDDGEYDGIFHSVNAIREYAETNWWGDGDDFIHYLKNLDTGEMLYEAEDYDELEYEEDDNWDEEVEDEEVSDINSATNTCGIAAKADTGLDNIPDELTVTIEGSTLDDIDECDDPIMSGSIPYGEYGQMLIDDEKQLRDQYDEGELAPSEIVESLGYVAQDDHVYIKDLGDGCNMVFDFTTYDMDEDDECIQHYFTDETGRIPRGYTVTKMYL